MKAIVEGLLSGAQGAIGAADTRIREDRKNQEAQNLVELQAQRQRELAELKQQWNIEAEVRKQAWDVAMQDRKAAHQGLLTEQEGENRMAQIKEEGKLDIELEEERGKNERKNRILFPEQYERASGTTKPPKSASTFQTMYTDRVENDTVRELVDDIALSPGLDIWAEGLKDRTTLENLDQIIKNLEGKSDMPGQPDKLKAARAMKGLVSEYMEDLQGETATDPYKQEDWYRARYVRLLKDLSKHTSMFGGLEGGLDSSPAQEGFSVEKVEG